ncbi:MAG TPA: hypothetical protein DCX22_03855 [Dehalococcoidia bacterium]|nr:hypothetical protein [Dehalococcoidia bacterium]
MIVDFHTHIFSPTIQEKRETFLQQDCCFRLLYSHPKAKLATATDIIASMDEHHIDISVIVNLGWTSHELCVMTNDYILESVARYPKRLTGFCAIQPLAGDNALKEIERCAAAGARGIGEIRPDMQGFSFSDTAIMQPVAQTLIERNMMLLTHASEPVGHQYAGKGSITPDTIYPFITKFPELRIICAHWGGGLPFYALMPEVCAALKNVYFDTAATPFLYKPAIFKHIADIIGSDHILFGSDYPLMPPKRVLDQLPASGLSKEDIEKICGANAQKLLSF